MTEPISASPRRASRPFSRTVRGRSMRTCLRSPPLPPAPPGGGDGSSYRIKICALNNRAAEFCFKLGGLWELNGRDARSSRAFSTVYPPEGDVRSKGISAARHEESLDGDAPSNQSPRTRPRPLLPSTLPRTSDLTALNSPSDVRLNSSTASWSTWKGRNIPCMTDCRHPSLAAFSLVGSGGGHRKLCV